MKITDTHIYFWREKPFSNWSFSRFKSWIVPSNEDYNLGFTGIDAEFVNSEQAFMAAKAAYFDDKETLKQISELRANLKNIIKLNNLSTEIFYDTFDEIEIDNEIDPVVSDLSTIDKFLITVNLISDIEKIKEENKKLVKKTKRLERDALLDSLSYLGYKVSEEEFSKEFKTTIENNREALSKGLFNNFDATKPLVCAISAIKYEPFLSAISLKRL